MKVLIADDDRTSRTLLAAMVTKWGYDPLVAEDGGGAWAALQQPDRPRLVLLDWNMPVLDGLDVCRRLRALDLPDPPYVILLTGRTEKGDIVHGLEAGANDYVAKPYNHEELQARLQVGKRTLALQAHLLTVQAQLKVLAARDPLTGILNRRTILERLAEELSRATRQQGGLTVAMCDLDHFKAVNDTYGHQAGDDVLRGFTASVQAHLRKYDSVGRYGGEEFLVIAPGVRDGGDVGLFERLCARISARRTAHHARRDLDYRQHRRRVGRCRFHGGHAARGGRRGAVSRQGGRQKPGRVRARGTRQRRLA